MTILNNYDVIMPEGMKKETIGLFSISVKTGTDNQIISLFPEEDFVLLEERDPNFIVSLKNKEEQYTQIYSSTHKGEAISKFMKIKFFIYNECMKFESKKEMEIDQFSLDEILSVSYYDWVNLS